MSLSESVRTPELESDNLDSLDNLDRMSAHHLHDTPDVTNVREKDEIKREIVISSFRDKIYKSEFKFPNSRPKSPQKS